MAAKPGYGAPLILGLAILLCLGALPASAQKYRLVWAEEFNAGSLDRSAWTLWEGTAYNNESQYYTPRDTNVYVADGKLHIRALKEQYRNQPYTSARLKSENHGDWKFGRVEARIKLPYGQGIWPAFWMMPTDDTYGGWPHSGEIDIMEMVGHEPDVVHGTVHYSRVGSHQSMGSEYRLQEGIFNDDFHVFAIEWRQDAISWFVDDSLYYRIERRDLNANPYPFNERFYVILNLAVGGNWPGYPDHTTTFPQILEVDWVRVYQDMNQAPTGSLQLQTDQDTLQPGVEVEVQIDATDEDGTVERLSLLLDGQVRDTLNPAGAPPYIFSWTPTIEGCFELGAELTDNDLAVTRIQPRQIMVGHGCRQSSYFNPLRELPATLPAYAFDRGGQGVAYNDADPYRNRGASGAKAARPYSGVDVRYHSTLDTHLVDWVEPGEWLEYTFYNPATDTFTVTATVLPRDHRNRLELELNQSRLTSFYRFPAPAPGDSLVTMASAPIPIERGIYTLRLRPGGGSMGIAGLEFQDHQTQTSIGEAEGTAANLPLQAAVIRSYPNPFNYSTTIQLQLARSGPVTLGLYTMQGKLLQTLHQGLLSRGSHSIRLDGSFLSSGMYLLKATTPGHRVTHFISLIK